ncbi:MAG: hypothetical protein NC043_07270 [Muribaculaceae bacterium]|nr:hypothetical protein [Muribaculaceae bacterium]
MIEQVGISTVLVWALIGLIGGYMTGRMRQRGAGYTVLAVVVGIVAAVAGGWIYIALFGAGGQNPYISLIISVAVCAIGLWLFSFMSRRRKLPDDTDDDA